MGARPSTLLPLALALALAGCAVQMRPARLAPPVQASPSGLEVEVFEVHVSRDVVEDDFSEASRVLVAFEVRALRSHTLDLAALRLSIGGGPGCEPARAPLATGVGDPPVLLRDGEHVALIVLEPGQSLRAWAAFGDFPERRAREIPERVELFWPGATGLVLSEPGRTEPWDGEPKTFASGYGLYWFQLSADEGSVNGMVSDLRWALGPTILSTRYGVGLRFPRAFPTGDKGPLCCNLALGADLSLPQPIGRRWSLAPYLGGEAALLLGDHEEVSREHWIGVAAGLEASFGRTSLRHGPFPIDYPRSTLGVLNLRLALVHWFGDDRGLPSFGASTGLSLSL